MYRSHASAAALRAPRSPKQAPKGGSSPKAAVGGTSPTNRHLTKTKLCKFYATTGTCRRGAACHFAHGTADLVAPPDLYKTEMCYQFSETGMCRFGDTCTFAHGSAELRPVTSPTSAWGARAGPPPPPAASPKCLRVKELDMAEMTPVRRAPASPSTAALATPSSTASGHDQSSTWGSDFDDGAWATGLPSAASSADGDDFEEELALELVVEKTFWTLKVARPRGGASADLCTRPRAASEPPRPRRG
mmetsp:Transcript_23550/g.47336  ORF Transcript_23550/g.47336 Transcript_23550/m.47336 type:complete len:247 (-) Transcript_23550:233-973(-)